MESLSVSDTTKEFNVQVRTGECFGHGETVGTFIRVKLTAHEQYIDELVEYLRKFPPLELTQAEQQNP